VSRLGNLAEAHWPWRGTGDGPLPALLIVLTVTTGMVDAVSYVALGHVFVANMTGNVVFLGFAAAGVASLSAKASLAAIAAFVVGALLSGRAAARFGSHRGRYFATVTAGGAVLVWVAVVAAALAGQPVSAGARFALIVPLAIATGAQNAMARRLAVADLTTTVLTMTLTGIAADARIAGGSGGHPQRRLIAVSAMFVGALVSATLVLRVDVVVPLAIVATLLSVTALAARLLSSGSADWMHPPG
jgi:uncharacterized membrane protein YoaK (UPF0700 family)